MPAYELFLIVKNLERVMFFILITYKQLINICLSLKKKPELIKSIKRGAQLIIKKNGLIRSFENLGFKNLPYKIKANGTHHTQGK